MAKFGSSSFKAEFLTPPLSGRPWSYSLYADFTKCKLKVKYKHVIRHAEAARPASDRGTKIHEHAEEYLKGDDRRTIPKPWQASFLELRRLNATPELRLAVDRGWKLVSWRDPTAWIRAKLDVHYQVRLTATVIDHKTGRIYEEHAEQADLYSVLAFSLAPRLRVARSELWYLDRKPEDTLIDETTRTEVEARRKHWERRVAPIFLATEFPATPGRHCSWCGYSSKRGGPCKYG